MADKCLRAKIEANEFTIRNSLFLDYLRNPSREGSTGMKEGT
jgi:hypothetical protein